MSGVMTFWFFSKLKLDELDKLIQKIDRYVTMNCKKYVKYIVT